MNELNNFFEAIKGIFVILGMAIKWTFSNPILTILFWGAPILSAIASFLKFILKKR